MRYNKNFDFDVATKSALQLRDLLLKNSRLKDSANSNTISDFRFTYYDTVQDELMEVFLEDVYNNLRERVLEEESYE